MENPADRLALAPYNRQTWNGGYGPVSVPNNQFFNMTLALASTAKVKAVLDRVLLYSEIATEFGDFRINPTGNLPTTDRSMVNAFIGGAAPVCVLKVDVASVGLTGGSLSDFKVTITTNAREEIILPPYILSPGITLGLSVPNTAGGAANILGVLRWSEFPL